jgi:hypothetical protein
MATHEAVLEEEEGVTDGVGARGAGAHTAVVRALGIAAAQTVAGSEAGTHTMMT